MNRRGAVTVEFALVVPLVMVLFFSAIELTWLNMIRNSVTNASWEAARRAAIPGATEADAEAAALRTLVPLEMHRGMSFSVTDHGDQVEVNLQVPVAQNSWGLTRLSGGLAISRRVRISRE